ncbi:MAG: MMPL family transporter, partial [Candidatus Thalassarchaeaceae archaeon]|nr:MMPL family transporter [Candidatus Thalassarchaeaceae archaeon]
MGDQDANMRLASIFESMALPSLIISILLTALMMSVIIPLPAFTTDLETFSPDSASEDAMERVDEKITPTGHRVYVHVSTTDGQNILGIEQLSGILFDMEEIDNALPDGSISSHINAADAIQRSIDERSDGDMRISEFSDWGEILNTILEDDEDCIEASADERVLATASFAASAMLHTDFEFEQVCEWLEDGSGDPTPMASSTLWVIELDGTLDRDQREEVAQQIRSYLNGENSQGLSYGVISDDLISSDINDKTLDEMIWLFVISIAVVVAVLALAFRSVIMVAAPLLSLSAALIWTYGTITLLGMKFSILEVAVAPVVLGLGIDYSIHLQRGYEKARSSSASAAEAWVQSFDSIRVALMLAVVTTVFAFLSNSFSPLPPLRTFGATLALGVISAFIASTVTVGAVHVVAERGIGNGTSAGLQFDRLAAYITEFQKKNTVWVMLAVAAVTTGSVSIAVMELDTSFELTDFLSEDEMEVMQVRQDIYDSYDAAAWKSVDIIIEPAIGEDYISEEANLLRALDFLDTRISGIPEVVNPTSTTSDRPSYDGLYPILRDAVDGDQSFGEEFHLAIYDGELGISDGFVEGDLTSAISSLVSNQSVGDPLRGETWSERISGHVALTDDKSGILFLKMSIDIVAKTSEDSSRVSEVFKQQARLIEESDGLVDCRAYATGEVVMIDGILSGLVVSQIESTGISLLVSILVLFLLTRRLGQSLVVILPVGLAGAWVVGSMAMLGLNWNVLTIMITALTIGLGIDYSIHVWRRFEKNRSSGMGVWDSMREMYATTGTALQMSARTTICGFLVRML